VVDIEKKEIKNGKWGSRRRLPLPKSGGRKNGVLLRRGSATALQLRGERHLGREIENLSTIKWFEKPYRQYTASPVDRREKKTSRPWASRPLLQRGEKKQGEAKERGRSMAKVQKVFVPARPRSRKKKPRTSL